MGDLEIPEGVFWADYIKTLKDNPSKRLKIALDHLPLPAAFHEAAIAIRGIIREQKKSKEDYESNAKMLYRLETTENFLLGTPYIEGVGPGFNVAEIIPRNVWEKIELPYDKVGFNKLSMPTASDKKLFEELWGEPPVHRSAQEYQDSVWQYWVNKFKAREIENRKSFKDDLMNLSK